MIGTLLFALKKSKEAAAAKEEFAGQINEYKKKLQELQQQREKTKDGFKEIVSNIADVDSKDENFFSKAAGLFKGYTEFHVYVVTCVSYARYQILKNKISNEDAGELKSIILGLIEAGFPKDLKKDVDLVWASTNENEVTTTYHKYKGKLDKRNVLILDDTVISINDYIKQYAALVEQEHKFEKLIATA
ncbi:hypothetical protein FACS1894110_02200 [Spirochaetia bacterium]|nr:hypothetical protein FACS1894110_02200 [Spirochaetia bacterium]